MSLRPPYQLCFAMGELVEQQKEECEVLMSIYEGDDCFRKQSDEKYQYKFIYPDCEMKSFLLELQWGEKYPDEKPVFNMDLFFNKHISNNVKKEIMSKLNEEADKLVGCAMTYTLFEWIKESMVELMEAQPETNVPASPGEISTGQTTETAAPVPCKAIKERKVQLTKGQKRRMADRVNAAGERPRGWNWVDIVKHLSQTGTSAKASA